MHQRRLFTVAAIGATTLVALSLSTSCSRKSTQVAPNAPEVLVTTVQPRDVPRVLERVATLDGFINANINAQVQGYIVSRDYQEGSVVKNGDLLFKIDPRPFEAALAQAKGTLAKDQASKVKADVTAGEGPFTDFVSRHPDPKERNEYVKSLQFELILGNGELYPRKGSFYALDRSLDVKTGSIRYYVTFPNPGNVLRPGQFGNVRFVADMKKGAMVIPQEAVNELQGSYQVAVVGDDNKVSIRPVKMGERIGAMWEVTEGLKPGDKVVVQGIQKAREGSTVAVKDWTPPPDALVSKADQQKKP